jgi:hypothetical protein
MANIGNFVPAQPASAIASYDWTSLITQQGYLHFYLCTKYDESVATMYFITDQVTDTKDKYIEQASGTATFTSPTFKAANILEGIGFLTICLVNDYGNGNDPDSLLLKLYHKDINATLTELASIEAKTLVAAAADNATIVYPFSFDISRTYFNVGDSLVFTLYYDTDTTSSIWFGTDPNGVAVTVGGVAFATGETITKLSLPFRLNI